VLQEKVLERQTVDLDAQLALDAQKPKPGRVNSQPAGGGKLDSLSARVGRLFFRIVPYNGLARHVAATLPASVPVFILRCRDEPQTTARLAKNRRAKQPLVESNLIFYPHLVLPPSSCGVEYERVVF
jgi:hypothetical protein